VYLIKLIKSNQVIIIMLYVYMYVVYFVMYDSVLILLLSYEHHDWLNKVFFSNDPDEALLFLSVLNKHASIKTKRVK
jgi:hypothetical protein